MADVHREPPLVGQVEIRKLEVLSVESTPDPHLIHRSGLTHAQIIMQVGNQGQRLKWPSSTPPQYRELAESCTHPDAAQRPKFVAIVAAIEKMQENVKDLECSTLLGEWD